MSPPDPSRRAAPLVLVTGGKGGVGKTTLAANLAVELALAGRRVLLADLDLGLANVHVFLRLHPERSIEDALAGRAPLESCVLAGPGGIDVLPASSGTPAMGQLDDAGRDRLVSGLRRLARSYDVVVADSAAGIGPDVLASCRAADHVLVVTTPEVAALTDAYGLIKAVAAPGPAASPDVPTPELVVNRASGLEEAEALAAKLRAVCERFLARSPRSAGWLPASPAIARSALRQRPFALEPADARRASLAKGCLTRIARRIERLAPARGAAQAAVLR